MKSLAGKLTQRPTLEIFQLIDKRGTRSEDDDLKDPYVNDRQTCAQFLRLFLARERDSRAVVGVTANDLDTLYHEQTDLDTAGGSCQEFVEILREVTLVIKVLAPLSAIKDKTRNKVRKLDAYALMMLFQDIRKNKHLRFDKSAYIKLASKVADFAATAKGGGKSTSGTAIREHYERFREFIGDTVGISLDPKRQFDDDQQRTIREKSGGMCAVCSKEVDPTEAEFDHFPIPHRDGGRTEIENGRLVHKVCHPRGRPVETDD